MTIFWPSDTKDVIDSIRNAIGRDIYIIYPASGTACGTCSLNPITNKSTDPFCPTCSGVYWINTDATSEILAHVVEGPLDIPWRSSGGIINKGEALVQIEYTVTNLNLVKSAKYFLVNDKKYFQKSISLRGVPNINRILVTLAEQED
jgi:hypothetical protein